MLESKRYDDETLKHLQKVQLMMLKDFIKICEDNDILYFVIGGTLLGTIRHEGFIPWDDDIDIIMFRKDFEKLNNLMTATTNEKYRLINVLNEETYHYTFARVMLKNTVFEEWWADQVDYTQNIFMDIFLLDNIPDNKFKRFVHRWTSFTLNQMIYFSIIKFKDESKLKTIIKQFLYYVLKLVPVSTNTLKRKCINSYRKYEDYESDEVCDFPSVFLMPIYDKKDFLPPKRKKFEDIEVNVPNNYDGILTMLYGNYMGLPPEDKRFRPAPEKIDFGKY